MSDNTGIPVLAEAVASVLPALNLVEVDFLEKSGRVGKQQSFVCPKCGNGSGTNKTGVYEKRSPQGDRRRWACFKCGAKFDLLDLWVQSQNLSGPSMAALRGLCTHYGISLPEKFNLTTTRQRPTSAIEAELAEKRRLSISQAQEDLRMLPDFEFRGLTGETLERFGCGIASEWRPVEYPNESPSRRILIPNDRGGYLARDMDSSDEQKRPKVKYQEGAQGLFNSARLEEADRDHPIFVVEGAFDAMSLEQLGFKAIGLSGTGQSAELARKCRPYADRLNLILFPDDDGGGASGAARLEADLKRVSVRFSVLDPGAFKKSLRALTDVSEQDLGAETKDANDLLRSMQKYGKDKVERLVSLLRQEEQKAVKAASGINQDAEEAFYRARADRHIAAFEENSARLSRSIPTGWGFVDEALDGGLFPGLYVVGAVSGAGKTTFCLQMADQVAASGRDVLIIALEMSAFELLAKSLSRTAYLHLGEKVDAREMMRLCGLREVKPEDDEAKKNRAALFIQARDLYSINCANHVFIMEGIGNINADGIRERVDLHRTMNGGKAPLVIVDYLQIVQSEDPHLSDKQAMDRTIVKLKQLSRDFECPVVVVSSFNRSSYDEPAEMAAFKESGAIEYSADVLLALEPQEMREIKKKKSPDERAAALENLREDSRRKAEKGEPEDLFLKVLKNRFGRRSLVPLKFRPKFNVFEPGAFPKP